MNQRDDVSCVVVLVRLGDCPDRNKPTGEGFEMGQKDNMKGKKGSRCLQCLQTLKVDVVSTSHVMLTIRLMCIHRPELLCPR